MTLVVCGRCRTRSLGVSTTAGIPGGASRCLNRVLGAWNRRTAGLEWHVPTGFVGQRLPEPGSLAAVLLPAFAFGSSAPAAARTPRGCSCGPHGLIPTPVNLAEATLQRCSVAPCEGALIFVSDRHPVASRCRVRSATSRCVCARRLLSSMCVVGCLWFAPSRCIICTTNMTIHFVTYFV